MYGTEATIEATIYASNRKKTQTQDLNFAQLFSKLKFMEITV